MAVVTPIIQQMESLYGHTALVTWVNIGDADTCVPVRASGYADRSVHAFGTFGGATITIQVSNERAGISDYPSYTLGGAEVPNATGAPANFVSAHDPQGVALTITAAKIEEVSELSAWIQPATAAGSASSITVAMCMRRPL